MEELKSLIKKLESSSQFKKVKEANNNIYLCSFFKMFDKEKEIVQIHYYDSKKDDIISFEIGEEIKIEQSKVFRDKKTEIKELKLDEIKINIKEAIRLYEKFLKSKHETPDKKIIVLQVLEKPVWNITYLTTTFNIINIKIDAISGEKISEDISSALSLGKR